ncbi:putative transcriptional regulatory protein pdtaR [Pontivivens insulae]|uniref:Putative transcriptional regulatory protein pdtaR n=2 Tax=Pontivivens insulae TaxID=1639689 RepID=A0A2R8A8B7_9RHOB|nr:response regulator receiver protein [Pontivivens insulae]SPF28479.1 putative transcriptional regulatory protein pdtaR [Pontivivens insulae]
MQYDPEALATALPDLRRFARALCGSQATGDAYAAATLESILAEEESAQITQSGDARRYLFTVFCAIWRSTGARVEQINNEMSGREKVMQERLTVLTPQSREALLLRLLEDFGVVDVAAIMNVSEGEARELIDIGMREIESTTRSRVLVIEDEPLIAMDISNIVETLGHEVIAVARTHAEAVEAVGNLRPDLILADIRLADGSSGIEAVDDILSVGGNSDVPVIFITAFPHRLLTGERSEPAYVITKPFEERKLKVLIDQALFFRMLPVTNV